MVLTQCTQYRRDCRLMKMTTRRVVKVWNSLPEEVVMSSSVKAFEAKLDKYWIDQPVKFDYKEELRL